MVLTALLAALVLLVYRLEETWLLDQTESRVRSQVMFALRNTTSNAMSDPGAAVEDVVAVLGSSDANVALVDAKGQTLAQAGSGTQSAVSTRTLDDALRGHPSREIVGADASRHMAVLVPLGGDDGGPDGVIQASVSLKDVDATLDRLQLLLTVGVATTHVLGMLLAFVAMTWSLRPLSRTVEVCKAIARGEYGERRRLPKGGDELGELGRAFDAMISDVQETVEQREQSERLTRQFAADASHELKSPLTVVSGYVDVLLRGGSDDAASRERALIGIRRETGRMSGLVSDLLTLSQIEAGSWPMRREEVELGPLAGAVSEEASAHAGDRTIVLARVESAVASVDAENIRRALRNLVDNAIQHTGPRGSIRMGLAAREGEAILTVRDDGHGIEERHLAHIFDRFYRADPSRSRDRGSAGLGLAITRAIVEAHGGHIVVQSSVGEGTEFAIHLPLLAGSAPK